MAAPPKERARVRRIRLLVAARETSPGPYLALMPPEQLEIVAEVAHGSRSARARARTPRGMDRFLAGADRRAVR